MTKHINITMFFALIGIFGTYDAGQINFVVMLLQSSMLVMFICVFNVIVKALRKNNKSEVICDE